MPNLKILDQIEEKLVLAGAENDEELKKIQNRIASLRKATDSLYTKLSNVKGKYGFADYFKKARDMKNEGLELPSDENFDFMKDFFPMGSQNQGLCSALETYVNTHENDEDKEKVNAVKEAMELAKLKYDHDMVFQLSWMTEKGDEAENAYAQIYADNNPEEVKEEIENEDLKENEKENEDEKEIEDNKSEIDDSKDIIDERLNDSQYEENLQQDFAIDLGHVNEEKSKDIFDMDESVHNETVIYEKEEVSPLDAALKKVKRNEQFTGSSEYTYVYDTLKSLSKIDKMLDAEKNKNSENELYKTQKENVLSQKKDMLCVIDHYLNRKIDEKNVAEAKGKKENKNSARRRKSMENLKKVLTEDINNTQKELGTSADSDKEFYASIRRELEFGDYITFGGSDMYNTALKEAKELEKNADKPRKISEIITDEIKLLSSMKTYLDERVGSQKKADGYKFSLNDGKDGKRLEGANNTQRRYQIMVKSMEKLSNHLAQTLNTYYPNHSITKNFTKACNSNSNVFGISINPYAKMKAPASYEEAIALEETKLSVAKEETLKKEIEIKKTAEARQEKEIAKRQKFFEDYKKKNPDAEDISKGYNEVYKAHNDVTGGEALDYAGYEFRIGKIHNFQISDYKSQAVDLLYANVKSQSGEKFNYKSFENEKQQFSREFMATDVGSRFCDKMGKIFDLNKNKASEVNNAQIKSEDIKKVLKGSFNEVFDDICKSTEAQISNKKPIKEIVQTNLDDAKKVIEQAKKLQVNDVADSLTQKLGELQEKAKPVMEGKKQAQKNPVKL